MTASALARAVGLAAPTVSRKLSRGMSEADILAEAKVRAEAKAAGVRLGGAGSGAAQAGVPKKGPNGYVGHRQKLLQQEAAQRNLRKGSGPSPQEADRVSRTMMRRADYTPLDTLVDDFADGDVVGRGLAEELWLGETIVEAERRNKIALADQNELKAAQMKGELVPIAQVNNWFSGLVVRARDILLNIGVEVQDRLGLDAAGVEMIDKECRRALEVLAGYGKLAVQSGSGDKEEVGANHFVGQSGSMSVGQRGPKKLKPEKAERVKRKT